MSEPYRLECDARNRFHSDLLMAAGKVCYGLNRLRELLQTQSEFR